MPHLDAPAAPADTLADLTAAPTRSTKETPMTAPTLTRPIHRATLPNGLRVCVVHDASLPVVALDVTYDVGSRDEAPDVRGFAHLFEHLMFAGSEHVAAGELSAQLDRVGGSPNAATGFDTTRYHVSVPTGALDLALWLEADRMGGMLAALDQKVLDVEREIVKNERRQTMETVPFGMLWEELHAALYPLGHPYHWMPMGCMAHLDAADLGVVRDFFTRHYAPDNAVLTLVGDVEPQRAVELAQRYFGGIARHGAIPPHPATAIEPLGGEVRVVLPEPMPVGAAVAAHRIPGRHDPVWPALDLAAAVLGRGDASRLGRRLVLQEELAQEAAAMTEGLAGDTDALIVGIWLTDGADPARAEQIRDEEIARLAADGPDEQELEQARAAIERELFEQIGTREGLAAHIGEEELRHPGADPLQGHLDRYAAVTAGDVAAAARTWLTPQNRVVVVYEAGAEEFDDLPTEEFATDEADETQTEESVFA